MEDKALKFTEKQFMQAGFAEAFTAELINQLKQGVPYIKHEFNKNFDGDQVNTTLHLKKSATQENYFLNKFELKLQREGRDQTINQTFYLTEKQAKKEDPASEEKEKQSQKYTLKKAYNLTAGRPVYDQIQQSWHLMNHRNVLSSGNHEIKRYAKNYGFDLEDVLSKYSIKELVNEQYKQSLIDSLHRGNLQKVTFVGKDGKEEKLYISPNITQRSLDVQDLNRQKIAPEKLSIELYLSKSLAEKNVPKNTEAANQLNGEKKNEELKISGQKIGLENIQITPKNEIKNKQTLKDEKPIKRHRQKIK
ncbi:MAG TPA: hypothetical protein VK543_19340 [Puia sp.]|nr:hypothetical protein [Puia sp.]